MLRPARLLLAALLLAPLAGCKRGPALAPVEAPAAGVTLSYDLAPGQVFQGRVSQSQTIRDARSSSSATNHFSFDLTLTVRGPDSEHGGMGVTSRFRGVTVRWSLPPGIPISVAEFNRKASEQLQGLEVDFSVDEVGKIIYMPDLPSDLSDELRAVLQQALDSLETAFVAVPTRPLKVGDNWKDERKRGRQGKLGRYVEGAVQTRVEGFYRTGEPALTVVKLIAEDAETEVTTTTSGSHEVKKGGTSEILFSTDERFLVQYTSDKRTDDAGNTSSFIRTEVSWKKLPRAPGAAATKQVQDISDPCHPDYVGAEECSPPAEGAPPADPAAGAPAGAPATPAPAPKP